LVRSQCLLRFLRASGTPVGLAQLKVGGVAVRSKLSGDLETLDGAGGVILL